MEASTSDLRLGGYRLGSVEGAERSERFLPTFFEDGTFRIVCETSYNRGDGP